MAGENQENLGTKPDKVHKLSRGSFLKVALGGAASVAGAAVWGESHKDYSLDGADSEIQKALEKEGVAGVHLRMYLGDHFFTAETMKKMEEQGVTVITGEINYKPGTGRLSSGGAKNASEDFFNNLRKLPNGVTGRGQMELMAERSAELLQKYSEGKAILASDNGSVGVNVDKAASAVAVGWGLFGSLLYFAGLAWKTGVLTEPKKPMTRRDFLKGAAAGAGVAITGLVGAALYQTAENRDWIEPPANSEVSYIYSKLFNNIAVDVSEKALEVTGDKRLLQAFQSLIAVRNKVIALNNWYFVESLERNEDMKKSLSGVDGAVEVGFFAGAGHSAVKEEFCKGPAQLGTELKQEIDSWLNQFEIDIASASPETRDRVVRYYGSLMGTFGRPYLIIQLPINQEGHIIGDYVPKADTPAAIMYRALVERGDRGRELLATAVKDQHFPDGTFINVSGKNVLSEGSYSQVLDAKNPDALKERFVESGFIAREDLKLVDGEIYPNLYSYDYVGQVTDKKVSVGIAIVRGLPMTYFQKEDTSFIKSLNN